ncbi:MAG: hypothetical protein FWD55_06105, partial [Propionibacteriaceae bacterium]|nr:hypothetical protein [Propionibacteriaceae bacterium]
RVVEGSQHLFNVMPWVDLQGPDHGQAGLQINVNAIPTVDMVRDKGGGPNSRLTKGDGPNSRLM